MLQSIKIKTLLKLLQEKLFKEISKIEVPGFHDTSTTVSLPKIVSHTKYHHVI